MSDDLTPEIAKNAKGPQSVSVPGLSVSKHNLRDQIEAEKFRRQAGAAKSRKLPIRFGKMIPPGAV